MHRRPTPSRTFGLFTREYLTSKMLFIADHFELLEFVQCGTDKSVGQIIDRFDPIHALLASEVQQTQGSADSFAQNDDRGSIARGVEGDFSIRCWIYFKPTRTKFVHPVEQTMHFLYGFL